MKVEGDLVYIEEPDFLKLGPYCREKALRLGDAAPFITRAVAWCYDHWLADQRASDDGWPPQVWAKEEMI